MKDLTRFEKAQHPCYQKALAELQKGRKSSHWMWYIFPQLTGLGVSRTARYFGITDLEEARAYLAHPVLGARLRESAAAILCHADKTAIEILGYTDAQKLRSSMTLFEAAEGEGSVFTEVLNTFFEGERDGKTENILGVGQKNP